MPAVIAIIIFVRMNTPVLFTGSLRIFNYAFMFALDQFAG